MIGLLIVGHIHFPQGLRSAAEAIAGEQPSVSYVDFPAGMSAGELQSHLSETAQRLDQGNGVLLLTDIAGGTPHQSAMRLAFNRADRAVLTGCNLSILIAAIMDREGQTNLQEFTDYLVNNGKQAIQHTRINTGAEND